MQVSNGIAVVKREGEIYYNDSSIVIKYDFVCISVYFTPIIFFVGPWTYFIIQKRIAKFMPDVNPFYSCYLAF